MLRLRNALSRLNARSRKPDQSLPAGIAPRLLTTQQVAAYLGFGNTKSVTDLVRGGVIPPPVFGKKWDLRAIDAALDRVSGLSLKE